MTARHITQTWSLWKANGTACSVYEEAKTVECFERVIVATESNIIVQKCQELEIDVVLISDIHPTGNDRVSKVAKNVDADHYVILMGDESPYKSRWYKTPHSISLKQADAVMLTEKNKDPVDAANITTIKLAINDEGYLIFMSWAIIPLFLTQRNA